MRSIVALLLMSTSALADDPIGHAKHHNDFYSKQTIPGSDLSCCNDKDCRPVKYKFTSKGVRMLIGGRWIYPPAKRVMFRDTPDAGGHWCGFEEGLPQGNGHPHTLCAIVPIPGV